MSYVAPVSAVLVMRCTASAATSPGPTTRPIGSVARSWSRRSSSRSPSSEPDAGAPTPGAAHEQQGACGPDLARGVAGDLQRKREVLVERPPGLREIHL